MAKTFKKLAIGAAVAGAAGYIAGILTAPKSGKETREDLANAAANTMKDAERQLKSLHTELGKLVDDARSKAGDLGGKSHKEFKHLVDVAKDSKEKVREVLSAVHEGDASDKDLDRAIKEARNAIDHIKDYLHK